MRFASRQNSRLRQPQVKAGVHRNLSFFDPLLFSILGARAMALVRLREIAEAAEWALKAAAEPKAHTFVPAIAAYYLAFAGRLEKAALSPPPFARRFRNIAPRISSTHSTSRPAPRLRPPSWQVYRIYVRFPRGTDAMDL
jgi:hypothetical protein